MKPRRRFRFRLRTFAGLMAGALAVVTAMAMGAGEARAAANCFPLVQGPGSGTMLARAPVLDQINNSSSPGVMRMRAAHEAGRSSREGVHRTTDAPTTSPFAREPILNQFNSSSPGLSGRSMDAPDKPGYDDSMLGQRALARVSLQSAQAAPPMPTLLSRDTVELSFLGHSSFLIRTPQNVTVVTDYNGVNRAPFAPDIVTMNHAHSSHYTDFVEPGVKHILRGWATPPKGYPRHNLMLRDLRVRNVATDIRDYSGGTEYAGNSIFIFEVGDLCLAHFGHLHHDLDADRLGRMGQIDVAMVPVDGSMTLPHEDMANAVGKVGPKMVVPMHAFGAYSLQRFTGLMQDRGYAVRRVDGPRFTITRPMLKQKTVLVFPEHLF
jgi:L-ascorbate metabolism protein UlaG (beta-lactamase superfamily)